MRILVETGTHDFHNLGDVAMLQVSVARLRELWPAAEIFVTTADPRGLRSHCPGTNPFPVEWGGAWMKPWNLAGKGQRLIPRNLRERSHIIERQICMRWPELANQWIRCRMSRGNEIAGRAGRFVAGIRSMDLVVAAGGGYIADSFSNLACMVLNTLGVANSLGKRSALFGQGIGPVTSTELSSLARRVLPRVDLIAVREGLRGTAIVEKCGGKRERIIVTGDDAIELAFDRRSEALGNGIGVNLRVATYSGIDSQHHEPVRRAIQSVGQRHAAPLIPIGICRAVEDEDARALAAVLGVSKSDEDDHWSTGDVIGRIGKCRVVVTGSYHGAVFALSQGIPAVAIVGSAYYRSKFEGLADAFTEGCTLVASNADDFESLLVSAVDAAWSRAEETRQGLLDAAQRQIDASRSAYRRLKHFVTNRSADSGRTDRLLQGV